MSTRYLLLAEGSSADPLYGKTMRGVLRYRRDAVAAILDSTRAGETEDGVPIVGRVEDALRVRADDGDRRGRDAGRALPAGVAELLRACVEHGLDVESGLHVFLADDPALSDARRRAGRRAPRPAPSAGRLSTATGENLAFDATIVLTVGSDCAIGKMTVSLELDLEARRRGLRSVFVPTGQTGMAIAGWGIAVDAVVSDFLAGAAERLVVEGAERGGELLWVEGQGSLMHPVYSGVTLGLYHGSVAAPARPLPRGRPHGDRGRRRRPHVIPRCASSSSCTSGSRSGAAGDGRRGRAQHAGARRRGGARGDRGGGGGDRPAGRRSGSLRRRQARRRGARSGSLTYEHLFV